MPPASHQMDAFIAYDSEMPWLATLVCDEPRADTSTMRHNRPVVAVSDEPPPIVMMERRRTPDRRTRWRGGRRDRDWLNRPPHALSHLTLRSRLQFVWRLRRGAD